MRYQVKNNFFAVFMRACAMVTCVCLGGLLWSAHALEDNLLERSQRNRTPITITSDVLHLLPEDRIAHFISNVHATQEAMTITSDEMRILYHDKAGKLASGNSVSLIDAAGNVHMHAPDEQGMVRSVTGDKAHYDVDEAMLVVEHNVTLIQEGNRLYGEQFIYNTQTRQSQLASSVKIPESEQSVSEAAPKPVDAKPRPKKRVKGYLIPKKKKRSVEKPTEAATAIAPAPLPMPQASPNDSNTQ